MIKAEKKTLKLSVEKPQYITVNDITYAQVDSWFGHCRRDLKLDIIYPETKDGKIYPCILWICGGKVQAACPWYPPTDLSAFPCESAEKCASSAESLLLGFNSMLNKEKAYQSSPVSKVTKDAPPFLIIHGNCDQVVPYVQSETLYGLLEKKDCDVTLLTLDGADHADIQFFQDEVWNRIADFFHEKLK